MLLKADLEESRERNDRRWGSEEGEQASPESGVEVCLPGDDGDTTGLLTHPGKRCFLLTPETC